MRDGYRYSVPFQAAEERGAEPRQFRTSRAFLRLRAVLVILCFLLCGCRRWQLRSEPSIEFTRVPPGREGGPDKLDTIEGRVVDARPGQQIVLYARSGRWWVQPLVEKSFTKIQPDSKWSNATHFGTEYAALLVEPGYRPPPIVDLLPAKGEGVVAVATAKGLPGPPEVSKIIHFSGYEWKARAVASTRGGGVTYFDPANAWTDEGGALHLRITNNSGDWTGAEVSLTHSLGYGSYRFIVRDASHLEPAEVVGMYTWDDLGADQNHREFDVEISRWGDALSKNAQFAVQPYYVPTNVVRFMAPSGTLTHSVQWEPGKLSFQTVRGPAASNRSRVVAEHVFTSGVPSPGNESVHLDLYLFRNDLSTLHHETEVVIEKFEYLP